MLEEGHHTLPPGRHLCDVQPRTPKRGPVPKAIKKERLLQLAGEPDLPAQGAQAFTRCLLASDI